MNPAGHAPANARCVSNTSGVTGFGVACTGTDPAQGSFSGRRTPFSA